MRGITQRLLANGDTSIQKEARTRSGSVNKGVYAAGNLSLLPENSLVHHIDWGHTCTEAAAGSGALECVPLATSV